MRNDKTKRRFTSMPWFFGLREWFVRNFDDASELHDYHYEDQVLTRKEADKIWLRSCREYIKRNSESKLETIKYHIASYTGYLFLRAFGWKRWNEASYDS